MPTFEFGAPPDSREARDRPQGWLQPDCKLGGVCDPGVGYRWFAKTGAKPGQSIFSMGSFMWTRIGALDSRLLLVASNVRRRPCRRGLSSLATWSLQAALAPSQIVGCESGPTRYPGEHAWPNFVGS